MLKVFQGRRLLDAYSLLVSMELVKLCYMVIMAYWSNNLDNVVYGFDEIFIVFIIN